MKWDLHNIKKYQHQGITKWTSIYEFARIDDGSGVYILANFAFEVVYIGASQNESVVETIAEAIENKYDNNADYILVVYTKTDKGALTLATKLIAEYNPANNAQHKINQAT